MLGLESAIYWFSFTRMSEVGVKAAIVYWSDHWIMEYLFGKPNEELGYERGEYAVFRLGTFKLSVLLM